MRGKRVETIGSLVLAAVLGAGLWYVYRNGFEWVGLGGFDDHGGAWAGTGPAAPAPARRPGLTGVVWGESSLAGRDRLNAVMRRAGSAEPGEALITAPRFEFLRDEIYDRSGATGKAYVAGDSLSVPHQSIFAFPLVAGAVPMDELIDGEPGEFLAAHPDTRETARGMGLRRTAGYAYVGGTGETVAAQRDAAWADYRTDPALVARARLDLKAYRAAAPRQFAESFLPVARIYDSMSAGRASAWASGPIDTLDFSVRAAGDVASVRLTAQIPAIAAPAAPAYARPAFPPGCFARADVCWPDAGQRAAALAAVTDAMARAAPAPASAEDAQGYRDTARLMADVAGALAGDATSVALGRPDAGAGAVVYLVGQRAVESDVDAELARARDRARAAMHLTADDRPWFRTTYRDGDREVIRLTAGGRDRPVLFIDLARDGRAVVATFASTGARYVGRVPAIDRTAAAPRLGFAAARVDLPALWASMGPTVRERAQADRARAFDELCASGEVAAEAVLRAGAIDVRVDVPLRILGPLMKLIPW